MEIDGGLMSSFGLAVIGLALVAPLALHAQAPSAEAQVRQTVQAFYDAFNMHRFDHVAEITTDDWNHINPLGGRTRGREQVLAELRGVHNTFLKNVTDRIEKMDVRFASDDVAVATVASRVSTFTTPDGVTHENEQLTHAFVVVKRGDRWLIMQDHNTNVTPLPAPGR
jgi:uncharacterized protein (TIGR02246 family)